MLDVKWKFPFTEYVNENEGHWLCKEQGALSPLNRTLFVAVQTTIIMIENKKSFLRQSLINSQVVIELACVTDNVKWVIEL